MRNGRPPYTRTVSKAARPRRSASSSGRSTGWSDGTTPRPPSATASRLTARTGSRSGISGSGAPIAGQQRARLHERLLDLGVRIGVPDDPAADPEVDPVLGDRERPDRQREVEVAVRVHAADGAHRGAAADRLESGDVVDRGDLRRAGDRAARERRLEQLGQPDPLPERPLDRGDQVLHARQLVLVPSAPASGRCPARTRARGRSARGRRSSRARRRPSPTPPAARRRRAAACP